VAEAWSRVRMLRDQLERSHMDAREKAARLDLIAFQLGEIERTAPKSGEDETLAASRQVLASAAEDKDLVVRNAVHRALRESAA